MFVWIGEDANELEKTESVKSGELLDLPHLHTWIWFFNVAVLGQSEYKEVNLWEVVSRFFISQH